jgi:hypothetical protein
LSKQQQQILKIEIHNHSTVEDKILKLKMLLRIKKRAEETTERSSDIVRKEISNVVLTSEILSLPEYNTTKISLSVFVIKKKTICRL